MFRFTIRDVLWLMLVVALALAWASYGKRLADEYRRLEQARREEHDRWLLSESRIERLETELRATTERLENQVGIGSSPPFSTDYGGTDKSVGKGERASPNGP